MESNWIKSNQIENECMTCTKGKYCVIDSVQFHVSFYALVYTHMCTLEHDVKCIFTLDHGMGQFKRHYLGPFSYEIFWSPTHWNYPQLSIFSLSKIWSPSNGKVKWNTWNKILPDVFPHMSTSATSPPEGEAICPHSLESQAQWRWFREAWTAVPAPREICSHREW